MVAACAGCRGDVEPDELYGVAPTDGLTFAGMAVILTTRKTQQAALLIGCAVLVAGSVFFALGESM